MKEADEAEGRICSRCIENKYLKKMIQDEGKANRCSECKQRRPHTVTIERFGAAILPVLKNCLYRGDEIPFFSSDSSSPEWQQEGEELVDHIPSFLGQDLEINQEIADAVIAAEVVNEAEGETAFFDEGVHYIKGSSASERLSWNWESIEEELKHRRRFFNTEAKTFFDTIFAEIDTLNSHTSNSAKTRRVIRKLPKGSALFRARVCSDSNPPKLFKTDPLEIRWTSSKGYGHGRPHER